MGDFDAHLSHFAAVLDRTDPSVSLRDALRTALLDFNSGDDFQTDRHRARMRLILGTAELQAYSMTMYAGWRAVVADFVARRSGARPTDLVPQTIAWSMLGAALSAYEYWLAMTRHCRRRWARRSKRSPTACAELSHLAQEIGQLEHRRQQHALHLQLLARCEIAGLGFDQGAVCRSVFSR